MKVIPTSGEFGYWGNEITGLPIKMPQGYKIDNKLISAKKIQFELLFSKIKKVIVRAFWAFRLPFYQTGGSGINPHKH